MTVLKIAALVLALYALLALGACALQERLIFYPQPPGPRLPSAPAGYRVEALALRAADGTGLEGWIVLPAAAGPHPAVLYFGGNAEEVSWMAAEARRFAPAALVLANYRGYGRSGGSPGERALFGDALALHDLVAARPDVDSQRLLAHGRSLGSAVAVHLASQRPICGVLLTSPFDSVTALARRTFGWLPLETLLRHRFDSAELARTLDAPLLVLAGGRDTIVPPAHSRALFDAWRGPRRYEEFPRGDHNDVVVQPGYAEAVTAFVVRCAAGAGG
jgi:pimeloyl-ACP methyl ester carboxylesterase